MKCKSAIDDERCQKHTHISQMCMLLPNGKQRETAREDVEREGERRSIFHARSNTHKIYTKRTEKCVHKSNK